MYFKLIRKENHRAQKTSNNQAEPIMIESDQESQGPPEAAISVDDQWLSDWSDDTNPLFSNGLVYS